ncbi:MAG: succinate--CoA ligase subunit alpha [Candidatus Ancillula sp.]|jgi:succinyl-CoA synthetase alpha subunit|nr:succinate--CoA ligase subunit alpha [Candidatus Ancillula sp.]
MLINKNTKVIVQGVTGSEGWRHTVRMLNSGTKVVGGTNPKKAGQFLEAELDSGKIQKVPVFGTVVEAIENTGADTSIIFVPPKFAKGAAVEAIEAGIKLLVIITEGIPVLDSAYFTELARQKGTRIVGPNCPGLVSFDTEGVGSNVGIIPDGITGFGPIGLVSKSGTLTYQMLHDLRQFGFSEAVGIGGDPAVGTSHIDMIKEFQENPDIKLIVMIGEIGGDAEEKAAEYIKDNVTKPVVAYIAGFEAPAGKTMGHAGAIISSSSGTAMAKKEALEAAGVKVGQTPGETAQIVSDILS